MYFDTICRRRVNEIAEKKKTNAPSGRRTNNVKNLVRISALDFTEGMYISSDLYVMLNDNYVLLCSQSVLSKDLIAKINDFELTGDSLYIDADFHKQMGKHHKLIEKETDRELLPVEQEYNEIKQAAAQTFKSIGSDEQIPWNQTTQLVVKISDQVKTVKAPFILQCISAIRKTDQFLYTHCVNVSLLNGLIAQWLGKSPQETEELINIGLLHDIGKLRISSSILDKPSKLSREEFDVMKKHTIYAYEMLTKSGVTDQKMLGAVRSHHEQMNGRGYPDALSADKIPEYARITAISDIYDAMVAKRVYKPASSPFAVLEQFAQDRFSHLDIHLVNVFLTQMSIELMGKKVKLSDGSVGEVLYVDKEKFNYPIVRVNDKTVRTDSNLYCLSLVGE